jgi:hypothetical protein
MSGATDGQPACRCLAFVQLTVPGSRLLVRKDFGRKETLRSGVVLFGGRPVQLLMYPAGVIPG